LIKKSRTFHIYQTIFLKPLIYQRFRYISYLRFNYTRLLKSFLLDIAWWVLTGNWVEQPAYPQKVAEKSPVISSQIHTKLV
jgi:hypothetical protein